MIKSFNSVLSAILPAFSVFLINNTEFLPFLLTELSNSILDYVFGNVLGGVEYSILLPLCLGFINFLSSEPSLNIFNLR